MNHTLKTVLKPIEERPADISVFTDRKLKLKVHQFDIGVFEYSVQYQTAAGLSGFFSINLPEN